MRLKPWLLVGVTLVLIGGLRSTAAEVPSAQALEDLDELAPSLMRHFEVPGLALAVVRGDSVLALRGYGFASVSDSVKVDPEQTVFRVASVAKVFVATVAAGLIEQGVIDPDADIRQYAPDIKLADNFPQPITLNHLLTHTAGFDERLIGYAAKSRDSLKALGEYLRENLPRRGWAPGAVTGYSNHGMALAAYLIESVTGQSFAAFARDSLFGKLGMSKSSFREPTAASKSNRAAGYRTVGNDFVERLEVLSHAYPAGMTYSTAGDMARFMIAQLNAGAVAGSPGISAAAVARLQRLQFTTTGPNVGMSSGFFNQPERGWRALTHAGAVPGVNNLLLLIPELRIGLYFVTNGGSSGFGEAFKDSLLARLIEPRNTVADREPISLSREYLEGLAGSYQLTRSAHYTIEKFPTLFAMSVVVWINREGELVAPVAGGIVCQALDSLTFRERGGERVVRFTRDAAGAISGFQGPASYFGADFPGTFERLSWFDEPRFKNEYLSYVVMLPLLALFVVWPLTVAVIVWRRRRAQAPAVARRPSERAALVVAGLGAASFAYYAFAVVAKSLRMFESLGGIVTGMTPEFGAALQVSYLVGALCLAQVGFTFAAWRNNFWCPLRRTYYTVLTLFGVLALVFLLRWNYLPPVWQ